MQLKITFGHGLCRGRPPTIAFGREGPLAVWLSRQEGIYTALRLGIFTSGKGTPKRLNFPGLPRDKSSPALSNHLKIPQFGRRCPNPRDWVSFTCSVNQDSVTGQVQPQAINQIILAENMRDGRILPVSQVLN